MKDFNKEQYDKASHIISSKYRLHVYKELLEGPNTQKNISNSQIKQPHLSRGMRELEEQNIVEILVSEDVRKGKIFGLTEEGKKLEEIVKLLS